MTRRSRRTSGRRLAISEVVSGLAPYPRSTINGSAALFRACAIVRLWTIHRSLRRSLLIPVVPRVMTPSIFGGGAFFTPASACGEPGRGDLGFGAEQIYEVDEHQLLQLRADERYEDLGLGRGSQRGPGIGREQLH